MKSRWIQWGIIATLLVPGIPASASYFSSDFSNWGGSTRAIGLGNAYAAGFASSDSVFENPASLDTGSARVNWRHYYEQNSVQNSISSEWAGVRLGFGYLRTGVSGITETDYDKESGQLSKTGTTFSYTGSEYRVSAAKAISSDLDLGATAVYTLQELAGETGTGLDMDLGVIYSPFSRLKLGFLGKNILEEGISWSTGSSDKRYREYRLGLAYWWEAGNRVLLDVSQKNNQTRYSIGLEHALHRFIALRLGLDQEQLSIGVGTYIYHFNIEFAYTTELISSDPYMIHLSIGYDFDMNSLPFHNTDIL